MQIAHKFFTARAGKVINGNNLRFFPKMVAPAVYNIDKAGCGSYE